MRARRPHLVFALVSGLGLLVALLHLAEVGGTPHHRFLSADQVLYDQWAREIAAGDWAGRGKPVFYMGPLYPYGLAVVYAVAGPSAEAAFAVQAVLHALAAGLVLLLARRHFGDLAGWVAGLLAAAYGPFLFHAGLLLGDTLLVLLGALALVLLSWAIDRPSWWRWTAAGVALGLAADVRGTALLFAPLVPAAVAAANGWRAVGRVGKAIALVALGVLVAVLPLTLHNAWVGGDRVLLTANAGITAYVANDPGTLGTASGQAVYRGRPMGLSVRDHLQRFPVVAAEELGRRDLRPSQVSRFWLRKTVEMIRADPGAWLRAVGRKALYAVNAYEVPNVGNYDFAKTYSRVLRGPVPGFGLVAPLGLAGLIVLAPSWRRHGVLYAFLLAQAAGLLAFFVASRYRLPLVLPLLAYAGGLVAWAVRKWRARERRALAGGLAALAAAAIVVNLEVPESSFLAEHVNLGVGYREAGDLDRALESFDDALALDPGFYYAATLKGEVLARLGRHEDAAAVLEGAREAALRQGDHAILARVERALAELAREDAGRPR